MWLIMQNGKAINTDMIIEIAIDGSRIIAVAPNAGHVTAAEYDTAKAAEKEYLNIISALERGKKIHYVNWGPWE